ncbi:MAG TPA: BTAD domain-containing putative transcriptional regulator [Ktedonobacteraceae bacterium]|jgi:ATP/maltotriose-dependent transcriptional regulator MalT/DNA-binding SARP family transcriptional activator
MNETALLRKIAAPVLPAVVLHRSTLVRQLQEALALRPEQGQTMARYRLVLCCAPAGYGKTILLADLARSTPLACCWYFLDKGDAAPVVFLRTLLASLRHTFPHFGASLEALFHHALSESFAPSLPACRSAIDALLAAAAIEISERFVIVLCNYEQVNDRQTINALLDYLVTKLPAQVTLIIESRGIPDLSFAALIVRDEIFSLHKDVLRFSPRDVRELAGLQGLPSLGEGEAEQLATSFDGWIAGILLGTRLGDARLRLLKQEATHTEPWPRPPSLIEHKRRTLLTYVISEILQQESATYRFLQAICAFQSIDLDICNAVCQISDAAERLALLERQGLFITSYQSASGVNYACHPIMRDLLSEQLRLLEPERFTAIHRQALELWRARHNDEQAVYHALAIGAYELAASLLLDAGADILEQGKHETLTCWLDAFPPSLQENHPHLLFLRASIALDYGQRSSAMPLLEKAETLAGAPGEEAMSILQARIALARSQALLQTGEYLQAQALCQRALHCLPEQADILRSAAHLHLGTCATLLGNFFAGITYLQQALHTCTHQPLSGQASEIHSALANNYYLTGKFLLAEHHLRVMLGICEQRQDIPGKVNALILSGRISQDQGQLAEAEASLLQAHSLARLSPCAQRGEASTLVNLGSLYLEQGKHARALTCLQDGLALAHSFGNRNLINTALANLALGYLLLGDAASAQQTLTRMQGEALSAKTMGYERIWHDLTYALVLYRQQRFDEAIACLRSLETVVQSSELKRGLFQVRLRLAACYIAQNNQKLAIHVLHEVATLLAANRMYLHIVRVEFQWLPELLPLLQNQTRLASLHALRDALAPLPPQQDAAGAGHATGEVPSCRLTIHAFGEPTVLLNGQPVTRWRMAHARELFFFLLEHHRPVSKEIILTSLWPRYTEQSTQTFHNTLYYLRKLLGEACVVFDPTGYSLHLSACYDEQVWYDVQIFQQLHSEAKQALVHKNEARAREAFLKMVELYRGDYGRCFYNDWCASQRETLRATYLEARYQLAQMAWHAQAWHESAEHFRQMLHLDHCLEEAHYGLIRCYMRQGKRGAALRQYRFCQTVLQEELGVQPGQALAHLYQRLTAGPRAT